MIRFCGGLVLLVACVTCLVADEYIGKVKSVEKDKTKITVTIEGKDVVFQVTKDPLVVNDKGKGVAGGILKVLPGSEVKIFTDKKDDKETATTIKVMAPPEKKK
ncbi:MAG: hypothetical protein JNM56_35320 [Planctomycetia bacterium]|nr:hypothetical protein [Planctomycetia bacterium]